MAKGNNAENADEDPKHWVASGKEVNGNEEENASEGTGLRSQKTIG